MAETVGSTSAGRLDGIHHRARSLLWQAVALVVTGSVLLLEHHLAPGFWLQTDKRNQYVPVFQDIGRRLLDGEFPVIDPALGPSGNYAVDTQYSLYDPLHLAVSVVASQFDNLALLGFVWSAVFLLVLTWGTTLLAQRLGAPGVWSAACGVVVATSGYAFYLLAGSWVPGLMSMAWLPWLWWFWLGRSRLWNFVGIAVTAYLVVAGGWPSTWLALIAWAVGVLVERLLHRDQALGDDLLGLVARALAGTGGAVAAVVGVLPLLRSADWTVRSQEAHNNFFLIPNLADVLGFASPVLRGDLMDFGGQHASAAPIFFAAWFALPVLWMVDWQDRPFTRRGLLTATVGLVTMLALTQAPSLWGPLRSQVRQLAGAQFFMVVAVAVLLAGRRRLVVSRTRGAGVAASLLAVAWLTWARDPGMDAGILWPAILLLAAFVLGVIAAVRLGGATIAGVVALVGTVVLSVGAFVWGPTDRPVEPAELRSGTLDAVLATGPALALFTDKDPERATAWAAQGMGLGMTRLTPEVRMAPGYSSVRQSGLEQLLDIKSANGASRARSIRRLFRTEPRTGRRWIDLLGYRTVVVERRLLPAWRTRPGWTRVEGSRSFLVFRQPDPAVTGRVTYADDGVDVSAVSVGREAQRYRVSAPQGGRVVFRDLYWPGYEATLDGKPIDVHPLGGILVQVRLPAGADGDLEVRFEPVTVPEIVGLTGAGVLLLAAAVGLSWWAGRRRRPS